MNHLLITTGTHVFLLHFYDISVVVCSSQVKVMKLVLLLQLKLLLQHQELQGVIQMVLLL
jgi:hypothetical protein